MCQYLLVIDPVRVLLFTSLLTYKLKRKMAQVFRCLDRLTADMGPAFWKYAFLDGPPETHLQVSVDAGLVCSFRAWNVAQQCATPGLRGCVSWASSRLY